MDKMVLATQKYLNSMYGGNRGYNSIVEDGETGWATINALTRALQIELGITETADNFGPSTIKLFNAQYPEGIKQQDSNDTSSSRVYAIVQGALWCKGYSTGASGITEHFYDGTGSAIKMLKTDAGYLNPNSTVTLNVMKALLSMNQYVVIYSQGGTSLIRKVQQLLNRKYENYIGLIPCDGIYSRTMNEALIIALQAVEGLSVDEATGNFGDMTKAKCPILPDTLGKLTEGEIEEATYLLKYSLCCNGYELNISSSDWDNELESALQQFQRDLALEVTSTADIDTWMSLLLSKGNPDRSCLACDTRFEITSSRATELKEKGYKIVGRYLTGSTFKVLRDDEPYRILTMGLQFFPIYQESADSIDYFTEENGGLDARRAVQAARRFGIPENTIIYFAVDLDVTSDEIESYILPYFKVISTKMDPDYYIGIYGTRNVCSQICHAGYAKTCFVSDMSTGYSGNMGFKIPENWNFDQFAEIDMYTSIDGEWEIDKDAYSGRYEPVKKLNTYIYIKPQKPEIQKQPTISDIIPLIQKLEELYVDWYQLKNGTSDNPTPFLSPRGLSGGITNFLRSVAYTEFYWAVGLLSDINTEFVEYVKNKSDEIGKYKGLYEKLYSYIQEGSQQVMISDEHDGLIDLKHLAATSEAYFSITSVPASWVGWAGDLATSMKETTEYCKKNGADYQNAADIIVGATDTYFPYEDMCGDADAIGIAQLIGKSTSSTHSFSESLINYYNNYVSNRFEYIIEDLKCSDYLSAIKDAVKATMNQSTLLLQLLGDNPTDDVINACCNSFANYIYFEL